MANHCVEIVCPHCGEEYCVRCNFYRCPKCNTKYKYQKNKEMETIIQKEIVTKTTEIQHEIDITNCFIKGRYNSIYEHVDAHIGVILKDDIYYIIKWKREQDKLVLETRRVKSAYLNKLPFQSFVNTYIECSFITKEEFMKEYKKVLSVKMFIPGELQEK